MSPPEEHELPITVPVEELPDFDGRPTVSSTLTVGVELDLQRAVRHGDTVTFIATAEVADILHKDASGGWERRHAAAKTTGHELPGRVGQRVTTAARMAYRLATEAGGGRTPIEGFLDAELDAEGLELTTDGSGVVITGEDAVDLGLADDSMDPRIVVFAGGLRTVWPDDYPHHAWAPEAGDLLVPPGADDGVELLVREVLDPVTGEVIGEWTDADEEQRLLEEEAAAAEAERGPDLPVLPDDDVTGADVYRQSAGLSPEEMQSVPPWAGYDGQRGESIKEQLPEAMRVHPPIAGHVVIYESNHKGRKGVIEHAQRLQAERIAEGGDR